MRARDARCRDAQRDDATFDAKILRQDAARATMLAKEALYAKINQMMSLRFDAYMSMPRRAVMRR